MIINEHQTNDASFNGIPKVAWKGERRVLNASEGIPVRPISIELFPATRKCERRDLVFDFKSSRV